VLMYLLMGRMPQRGEQLTGRYPCYAVYETRDGRHVSVGAVEPHFWATSQSRRCFACGYGRCGVWDYGVAG